ncbi:DUF1707 SHOCT-like domain-containing protein [Nonomuraea africana]|uniref:DUF1707 SHOCT-like domain-containing protein n=1 Tax=Nonomuraea africana TaxID=46171 RepID=UPI0033D8C0EE
MTTADELRIGDAERDRTMEALREHYAQGRLTREELDERLDLTLTAKTAGQLARVCADLPGPAPRFPEEYDFRWPAAAMAVHHRRHLAHRGRPHHLRRRHRGPGPIAPLLLLALIIALAVGGFSVLKVLFFVWVAAMVGGFVHRRAHLRRLGP